MANFPVEIALPLLALAGIAIVKFAFMPIRVSSLKLKRKRLLALSEMDTEEAEEGIGRLPDEVLCSIIQRLDIKDAVKTSILSRRWRYLYASLPHIRFPCLRIFGDAESFKFHFNFDKNIRKYSKYQQKFVKAVDGFLSLYAGPKMHSFDLSCCFPRFCLNTLERWIRSVGKLGVERLSLDFMCVFSMVEGYIHKQLFAFECRLLSETPILEHLVLRGCCLESNFTGRCYSLKNLNLEFVYVESGMLENLLSNCLGLDSLILKDCKLPTRLRITVGPLKFLKIKWCRHVEEIEISASSLRMFEFCGERLIGFSHAWVPALEKLSFFVNAVTDIFFLVGRWFPHVKSIVIEGTGHEVLSKIPENLDKLSAIRHLTLPINEEFADILDACPFLETLNVLCFVAERPHMEMRVKPITHLKEVEFSGFRGKDNQMELALCILRGAVVLEKMTIYARLRSYGETEKRIMSTKYCFSENMREMIVERLQGQAVSDNCKLIVL